MKYTSPVRRTLIAVGALAIISAPTAFAEPGLTDATTSTTASAIPTSTTPTTTTSARPTTQTTTVVPSPTVAAESTRQTTTRPAGTTTTTTTGPASTTASTTPTSAAPTTSTAPGTLRVDTGVFTATGPVQVGGVVPGTMSITVTDTRPDSTGWTTDVRVTDARGSHGNTFSPGPDSYYRAQSTQCSTSAGQVPLRENAVIVATAPAACPTATWTSDVGIAVPPDATPDDYTLTITHSVY